MMYSKLKLTFGLILILMSPYQVQAQNFPGIVGEANSTAIHAQSPLIKSWLSDSVYIERGWINSSDESLGLADFGSPEDALGASDPQVVSLGDGGSALYVLNAPLADVDGFDFAVFENGFDDYFLEFAHVEVSSNGIDFVRFPSVSNTAIDEQTDGFGYTATEYVSQLAGKYRGTYGTPFDLSLLLGSNNLNINQITHIKLIDVVGSVDPEFGSYDSQNQLINDPWPSPFSSSGFDLDALALLHPESSVSIEEHQNGFPVFVNNNILQSKADWQSISIFSLDGRPILHSKSGHTLNLSHLKPSVYIYQIQTENGLFSAKLSL
ncbi:MAG: T9SS type A sorting domain-containing protein [Flavobacteriales bacterium]